MRFLLARAVNPPLTLVEGLRHWNQMATGLRERPRKRRYQQDDLEQLLS